MLKIDRLFQPADNSPLILFRIIFGLLICLEAWGAILTGWVHRAFILPDHTFPFIDFSWLQPLPGSGMYIYYIIMGAAGLGVMLGFYYRISISIYTVLWTFAYLMQKTNYNNHYYLLILLCLFMCIVPANAYASYDARKDPSIKSNSCPRECLYIFVLQIAIIYFYAAIAKINSDWLAAKSISLWFAGKANYPLVGDLLQKDWVQYGVVYGGLAFDLLIVPALLWRKTRKAAFFISIFFHLFNSFIFQVGIFPYMGLAWAAFFFHPDYIRKLFFKNKPPLVPENHTYRKNYALIAGFSIYFLIQLLLPIRHHFFQSHVSWTEEGHRMAWRMMLRYKRGSVTFRVVNNKTGNSWVVNPRQYVTPKQARAVATKPDMCWQFIQLLKQELYRDGHKDVSIYATSRVALNGKEYKPLFDPTYDLAKAEWHKFKSEEWLTKFDKKNR